MKKYKLSKYNLIFERNDRNYLWNTLTDALIVLNDEGIAYLNNFHTEKANESYFEILEQNGCIVDERYDELGKVLYDAKFTMLDETPIGVHYTIAPGLGCNYNCPYCFEKDRSSHMGMTKEVQDKTCEYIIKAANRNHKLKHIDIRWFGGEPLLYMDAIIHISENLMKHCENKGIIYTAGIVTNGRYLSPEYAKKLKSLNISYVQLSIDGLRNSYAVSKGTSPDDFDATVDNLVRCADILPITVRINVSDSIEEAKKLTDYLLKRKGLDGKIKIYIAHIRDYSENNPLKKQEAHGRFLENERDYFKLFGEESVYTADSLAMIKPKRRSTPCLSICRSNFCIGPEGELYRCEHFFGRKDHIVGTVQSGCFHSGDDIRYLTHTYPSKCMDCQLFPVCVGGCMNDVHNNDTSINCEKFKERLIDHLLLSL